MKNIFTTLLLILVICVLLAIIIPVGLDAVDPLTYRDPAGYVMQTGITTDQSDSAVDLGTVNVLNAEAEVMMLDSKVNGFSTVAVVLFFGLLLVIGAGFAFKGS